MSPGIYGRLQGGRFAFNPACRLQATVSLSPN
jgi:hypothetical protein